LRVHLPPIKYIKNEKGLTLIEVIVASAIFLLIVLPLTSYYLSGIKVYNQSRIETNLRNETDSILFNILNGVSEQNSADTYKNEGSTYIYKGIQDASDFAIEPDFENDRKETLIKIFSHNKAQNLLPLNASGSSQVETSPAIKLYTYDDSKLMRSRWTFENNSPQSIDRTFKYNRTLYIADALFSIQEEVGSNEQTKGKILTIYLVIAPRTLPGKTAAIEDGQKTSFGSSEEILAEMNRLEAAGDQRPLSYIRIIKTELAINSTRRG
jgi:prepilin-type N-terminal cleavage/methylation domain-containing protein